MRWCQSCVLPDSRPNLKFNAESVCNACLNHQTKPHIDWDAREKSFVRVVEKAKQLSRGYDCLIPVSGGKDSTWQTLQCLEYGLKPLAVTWKTPGRTAVGQRNLDNLIQLGVDHIDYQISPQVEKRFMLESLKRFGTPAIPMHMALFNIPLTLAVRFQIPLVVYGENSAFEYGDSSEADTGFQLNQQWLQRYGVMHGTSAQDWVSEELSAKDLTAYFGPDDAALEAAQVRAVFLGYYFNWDPERTLQRAQAHGFQARPEGAKTGYYDYADIDDDFISIHHYIKWYKFGFTRLFDNLSLEIRNGRLSRSEALDIIRQQGHQAPLDDIRKFCAFVEISESEFWEILEDFRNPSLWSHQEGRWSIPDFIFKDWNWT